MSFALFAGGRQISPAVDTESDVWVYAERLDALTEVPIQEDDAQVERVLAPGFSIRPCAADAVPDRSTSMEDLIVPKGLT
ncbi:hypothetical protein [Bradyrhizobium sp. WD16]|uniref:hypothetical protein n=1 Tax=Bradyrhizobium sp. WD16 TaxID=1521768 RepID=UPI0020A40E25|nr:hypothetical protein [Bradyrhizobium sp. WD16]UTD29777.1 hypothetical protein DB459_25590 [Bradyrhizobium sp. WD16]